MPWLFRRKQPRSSTDLQALTQQMGLPGTSAAIGRPADFFANDWSASRPANPTVISVNAYGPMLDHALAVGDAINSLGPEELDTLHAATQALASVRPSEAHFVPVHHATVDYLESRLAQAVADGRYTAAIFNSNHRNLVDHLRQEKESADVVVNRKLAALQATLRRLHQASFTWFENLQLQDSTLTWLYLDDIVDARA